MKKFIGLLLAATFLFSGNLFSQKKDNAQIRAMLENYKKDDRGPFRDIRWFCKDGTINMPKEPCEKEGGRQHARHKEAVEHLLKLTIFFWDKY